MVVNLAAGLDTRPYRMLLRAALQWIEVDLPDILSYKEEILADEKPACVLERVRLDLSDATARRELFTRLGRRAGKILILTEGLIVYFSAAQVRALAQDLAAPPAFQGWILDLASPGLLRLLKKNMNPSLSESGSAVQFGRRKVRSSLFLTDGGRLMCARHSRQRHVSNAFHSACSSCLCYRSRTAAKARARGQASASSPNFEFGFVA